MKVICTCELCKGTSEVPLNQIPSIKYEWTNQAGKRKTRQFCICPTCQMPISILIQVLSRLGSQIEKEIFNEEFSQFEEAVRKWQIRVQQNETVFLKQNSFKRTAK